MLPAIVAESHKKSIDIKPKMTYNRFVKTFHYIDLTATTLAVQTPSSRVVSMPGKEAYGECHIGYVRYLSL
jgi:hypothetical protein